MPTLFPGSNTGGESEANTTILNGVPAARFVSLALPLLQQLPSLEIIVEGTATEFEELTADPLITVSAQNTETNDWFDLGVEVQIDGNKVPFTELFQALAHNEKHLMLPNGKYFELDRPEYEQLRRLIEEARSLSDSHGEDTVRISKHQASLWEDLKELATNAEATAEWKTSAGSLVNISSVEHAPVPAGINATLRPYQREGFEWLSFLYDHSLGGVLADDMGLGKTLQTLALIQHAKDRHDASAGKMPPFLVVAPTSVVSNWVAETRRFAPGSRPSTSPRPSSAAAFRSRKSPTRSTSSSPPTACSASTRTNTATPSSPGWSWTRPSS